MIDTDQRENPNFRATARFSFCLGVLLPVGLLVALFGPGLYAHDSLVQLAEARTGSFGDHHPPLMALVMRAFLELGILNLLGPLLCLGLWSGIWSLLGHLLRLGSRSEKSIDWMRAAVLVLLAGPWHPLGVQSITVIKDTFLLTGWIWALVGLFHSSPRRGTANPSTPVLLATLVSAWFTGFFRHNAWPLGFLLAAASLLGRRQRLRRLLIFVLFAVSFFAGRAFLHSTFSVQQQHTFRVVAAYELIGMLVLDPSLDPHTTSLGPYLYPEFREYYRFGHAGVLPWTENRVVRPEYYRSEGYQGVTEEYLRTILRVPWAFAKCKALELYELFGFSWSYAIVNSAHSNDHELTLPQWSSRFRSSYLHVLDLILHKRLIRPLILGHGYWLILCLVWLLARLDWSAPRLTHFTTAENLLLISTLAYTGTYVIATAPADFRYLFPSTLLVQLVVISKIIRYFGD